MRHARTHAQRFAAKKIPAGDGEVEPEWRSDGGGTNIHPDALENSGGLVPPWEVKVNLLMDVLRKSDDRSGRLFINLGEEE